jgi:hypothetical protein
MRNTTDVTGGKPIAVLLQSISGVSAVNPLVAFYDIHRGKREVLFFYFVPDTTRDIVDVNIKKLKAKYIPFKFCLKTDGRGIANSSETSTFYRKDAMNISWPNWWSFREGPERVPKTGERVWGIWWQCKKRKVCVRILASGRIDVLSDLCLPQRAWCYVCSYEKHSRRDRW